MADMDQFDRDLRDAMLSIAPPADFAARTAREAKKKGMGSVGIRPGIWGALAAAACLLVGVILSQLGTGGSRNTESGDTPVAVVDRVCAMGESFVITDGNVLPYRGRTYMRRVWNISQNAPEIIVEAFPHEEQ